MKSIPYWLDTAPPGPDRSGSQIGGRTDVAVIGAGFTGLSAALHLARKGVDVQVLEQETVGWGASGRNGGMATTGLSIGFRDAVARYGAPSASTYYTLYNDAIDAVEKIVADEGIDCDFARTGRLSLAAKPAHFESLKKTADLLYEKVGQETIVVPKSEIRSEIGSDYYHGAVVDPLGAGLHVGKYVRGLADAAEKVGATIHEKASVQQLRRLTGTAHEVTTSRGTIQADQVLIATSGYTRRPFRWQQVRIAPVGSFIIVTEPLDEELRQELMPHRRMASDTKNLLYYFRLTPDHRMLFGGRAQFAISSPEADVKSGRILQEAMVEVFPQLAGTRVEYCWGGLVDISLDRMVHAGEHDGLFYSLGYSGHGVQMASYMGKQMAEVLTGNPEANPWGDLPFKRIPGHVGPPWFLPFAGAYYSFQDRIR